jgi:hypothetical protein
MKQDQGKAPAADPDRFARQRRERFAGRARARRANEALAAAGVVVFQSSPVLDVELATEASKCESTNNDNNQPPRRRRSWSDSWSRLSFGLGGRFS